MPPSSADNFSNREVDLLDVKHTVRYSLSNCSGCQIRARHSEALCSGSDRARDGSGLAVDALLRQGRRSRWIRRQPIGLRTHLSGSPADTRNGPLQSEVVTYVVFRARHGRIRIDNVSQEPVSGGGEVAACVNGPRLRHKAIAEHVGPSRDGCKSGVWPFVNIVV